MRAQNKIAVGVGIVVIALGFFYFRSNEKAPTGPLADSGDLALDEKPASEQPVTEPLKAVEAENTVESAAPVVDKVASPAPRQVETIKFNNEDSRPTPSATKPPESSVVTTTPPSGERAGLSSLPPALPIDEGSSPVTPESEMKPVDVKPAEAKPMAAAPAEVKTPETTTPNTDMPPNVVAKENKAKITAAKPTQAPKSEVAPPIGAAAAAPATARTHVIQKGDTYTSLAVKYLGHAKFHKLIAKANPGRDAGRLYVGAKINIPAVPTANVAPAKNGADAKKASTTSKGRSAAAKTKEVVPPPDPSRAYIVQRGDSWPSIARKFLGKEQCDAELYELNKERVGGDPNLLRSGLVIELPARAKMPTRTAPTPATPNPAVLKNIKPASKSSGTAK